MTEATQVKRMVAVALGKIRREHASWVRDSVWDDEAYLSSVLRTVAGRSQYRKHGAGALPLLKQALGSKARGMRNSVRGFRNVADELAEVKAVLADRLGDGSLNTRYSEPLRGSPSVYFYVRGREGREVVIRVSDHPPSNRANETLIDISPMGYSAFSDWFLRRLDVLGVGTNTDIQDRAG